MVNIVGLISLDKLKKGEQAVIKAIDETCLISNAQLISGDVEGRLLEMGFIEGAKLQVLHVGIIGHDPIAVRINNSSSIIALRKKEASTILVEKI